jgi:hypothetical protein
MVFMRCFWGIVFMGAWVPIASWADAIVLKNGSVFEGTITRETPQTLTIEGDYGTMTLERFRIREIQREGRTESPVVVPPSPTPADEGKVTVRMEYADRGFPLGIAARESKARPLDPQSAQERFDKAPSLRGGVSSFGILALGGTEFFYLIDEDGQGLGRIYVDENRNGDLSDDGRIYEPGSEGGLPTHLTLRVPYAGEQGKEPLEPYRIWCFARGAWELFFYAACHRAGEFVYKPVAGKPSGPHPVILFDNPADGRYDNDFVVIDLDGDSEADEDERCSAAGRIRIDGEEFTLEAIAPDGRQVVFRRAGSEAPGEPGEMERRAWERRIPR